MPAKRTSRTLICARCGDPFDATPSQIATGRRFCSRPCVHGPDAKVERTCAGCGRTFQVYRSELKYAAGIWCTARCRYDTPGWQDALGPKRRKDCVCGICGAAFTVVLSLPGIYCSRKCLGIANGRRNPGKNPDCWLIYTCEECGQSFSGKACLSHRKRFCSRSCTARWTCRNRRLVRPTSIELALEAALLSVGVVAIREYRVGPYNIDFAVPDERIAVEADGTYWHSLPKQQAADVRKNAALGAAGWTVIRFSEDQINADAAACAARVVDVIRSLSR